MPEMLFYEKPVPLSNITHADWKLDRSELRYEFADKINSVVLAGIEFVEASKDYPIDGVVFGGFNKFNTSEYHRIDFVGELVTKLRAI